MIFETDAHRLSMLRALGEFVVINGISINSIFDLEYLEQSGGGMSIEGASPVLTVRDIDIVGVAHGNPVTVRNEFYQVVAIEPDGVGMTRIILERV